MNDRIELHTSAIDKELIQMLQAENAELKARWEKLKANVDDAAKTTKYPMLKGIMNIFLDEMLQFELESGGEVPPTRGKLGGSSTTVELPRLHGRTGEPKPGKNPEEAGG